VEDLPTWDETERPPLVTYADATPHARAAQAHLRAIHEHYRHGLALVVATAEEALAGRADAAEVREAIHAAGLTESYQRLSSYCGQLCVAVTQHHTIEDVVFQPQLRAADPAMHATLDRIAHEHEVVHALLERVDRSARTFASDREHLDALTDELRHLRDLLESHFAYEEDAVGLALGVHGIGV
jgi:hypothetical protein